MADCFEPLTLAPHAASNHSHSHDPMQSPQFPGVSAALTPEDVVRLLGLEPLPNEGGMFGATWLDERSSSNYYFLRPPEFTG